MKKFAKLFILVIGLVACVSCGPTWKLQTTKTTVSDIHDSTTVIYGTHKPLKNQ